VTIGARDKRALTILGGALVLGLIYWFATSSSSSSSTKIVGAVDSVDRAEKRLATIRKAAAMLPAKDEILRQASSELSAREKGLIPGDTADQAQAQLLQILRRIARAQSPPLEIRQVELAQPRGYGSAYGMVSASVTIDCRIEDLVNFLTSVSATPEIIATDDIRFGAGNPKQKVMPVRITVSGIVARRLIPEKKGPQL
jgi:Tfp pilus assembly protein PilO